MLLPWLGSGNQRNFWLWNTAHLNFKIPTRTRLDLATSNSICDPPKLLEMKIISPIKAGWKYSLWVFPVYIREPYQSKNSAHAATAHLALLQINKQYSANPLFPKHFHGKNVIWCSLSSLAQEQIHFPVFRIKLFHTISKPVFMGHFYNLFPWHINSTT